MLLEKGPADAGMSHVEITFFLRNQSGTECILNGIPAVKLLDAQGRLLESSSTAHGPVSPISPPAKHHAVLLGTGQKAQFRVAYGNSDPYPRGRCPGSSVAISVLPPGNRSALTTDLAVQACTRLIVSAVEETTGN